MTTRMRYSTLLVLVAMGIPGQAWATCATRLVLQVDYVGDTGTVTRAPTGVRDLAERFCDMGIAIDLKERTRASPGDGVCFTNAMLNTLLNQDEDRPTDGSWYAHGVVVPACCSGQTKCPSVPGQIFFSRSNKKVREKFVINAGAVSQGLDIDTLLTEKLIVTVHELAHVLNLHHCEINDDRNTCESNKNGTVDCEMVFGTRAKTHFTEAAADQDVSPGETGTRWCSTTMASTHSKMHTEIELDLDDDTACDCDDDFTPTILADRAGEPATVNAAACWTGQLNGLTVRPEKRSYLEREPISLDLILGVSPGCPQPVKLISQASLDPAEGYVTFLAGSSESSLQPVTAPRRARPATSGAVVEPGGRISHSGYWLSSDLPENSGFESRSFWVAARFTGFVNPRESITSPPVEIRVAPKPDEEHLSNSEVRALFDSPPVQEFLEIMGGDPKGEAGASLAKICREYPGTIYAPYAALALGVQLAGPFHDFHRDGSVTIWPPRLSDSLGYLEQAQRGITTLPYSLQVKTYSKLIFVEESLGDREHFADKACEYYGKAKAYANRLGDILESSPGVPVRPVSESEMTSRNGLVRRLAELEGKIKACQPAPPGR